jgi:heavy metal translocating P-type ATPase
MQPAESAGERGASRWANGAARDSTTATVAVNVPQTGSRRHQAGGSLRNALITAIALGGIASHLALRYLFGASRSVFEFPLQAALLLAGAPLVYGLAVRVWRREFGADLLAGLSIVTSIFLGQYLAGAVIVLMLAGGNALEDMAARRASAVLEALARRMPSVAHREIAGRTEDVALDGIHIGDVLVIYPHEVCPVDGVVVKGHGAMDESYLTGEPYHMSKAPGAAVLSGAINGDAALTIRSSRLPVDSRYARIMRVMEEAQQKRPHLRRLGDLLGAYYTPFAVIVALAAWYFSGDSIRFLAVLVIATPCPLLLAIPVCILASISLAARRGIVIRDPSVLERVDTCRTMIFDKTGTLTYGQPWLTEEIVAPGFQRDEVRSLVAGLEQYSKHPLASAMLRAARKDGVTIPEASEISEPPGKGLQGIVNGHGVWIGSRARVVEFTGVPAATLPPTADGLECLIAIDGLYAATYRFRDEPRAESQSFIAHLRPRHLVQKVMLVSGDREAETLHLARRVGVSKVYASKSPEEKVAIVREETSQAKTLFVGDGINDAPALLAATVGVAFGKESDITAEAAGAVILEASLAKVDEFLHIGRRMRSVALQSVLGGMALSLVGMGMAATGHLPPVAGALAQEIIDVLAIANALRAGIAPKNLTDF